MKINFYSSKWTIIFLFILFVIDRVTKQLAWLTPASGFSVAGLSFKLQLNAGLIFNINLKPVFIYLLIGLTFMVMLGWLKKLIHNRDQSRAALVGLILLAGFSNLWDRWFYGGVIDFIGVYWLPVFNLADLYIGLAVVWLIVLATFQVKNR